MADRKRSRSGKSDNKTSSRRDAKNSKNGKISLTRGKKALVGVCTVLLVFVIAAMVGFAYFADKINRLDNQELDVDKLSISDELGYDATGYLNVALFGLDTRTTDEEMGSRSDTIIIASLNRETSEVKLVSVYRDTLMQLDDGEYYKANAAYSYGGEEEAIAMLNRNLDLDIQYYVTVDFNALVDVIDALGGVDINVTEEELEYINGYILEIMENTGVESPGVTESGLQHLNGTQATAYARIRYTNGGDYTRAERQRTVLMQMFKQAKNSNLSTINTIIDKTFPEIKTNFTMKEILAYAKNIANFKMGEDIGYPMNQDAIPYGDQGSVVVSMDTLADIKELHEFLFDEENYFPSSTVSKICEELDYIYSSGGIPFETEEGGSNDSYYDSRDFDWNQFDSYDNGYGYGSDYGYEDSYDTGDTGGDPGWEDSSGEDPGW